MILEYTQPYIAGALTNTVFVFTAGESEPPEPPVEFGPGVESGITISASSRRVGVSGSNVKGAIGGSNRKVPIGGNRSA